MAYAPSPVPVVTDAPATQAREQVDKNYQAFLSMLPNIITQHQNKYALMKDGQL